jgi:putative YhdH/YhfP family quinone oxidoreductase
LTGPAWCSRAPATRTGRSGDHFIHNGWGLGETRWGLLAERASLQGQWLVRLPAAFTTRQAMAIGTAGYTAMLCVMALQERGLAAGQGLVLVTGATGGVGSMAVALLAGLGYTVVAATGKADEHDYLKALGAAEVIDRASLGAPGKPLQKERWAGVVDAVGSHTLANACAQTRYGGVVAACGLAQGADLAATVMPFILRGVSLAGIDSVMAPLARRQQAWAAWPATLMPPNSRPWSPRSAWSRPRACASLDARPGARPHRRQNLNRTEIRRQGMSTTEPVSYADFYRQSLEQPEVFWAEQARLIDWFSPPQRICNWDNRPLPSGLKAAQLNLCHNAVDRHLQGSGRAGRA